MLLARCSAPEHASVRSAVGSLRGSAGGAGRLAKTRREWRSRQQRGRCRQRHIRCRRTVSRARWHGQRHSTLTVRLRGRISARRRHGRSSRERPGQREDSRLSSTNDAQLRGRGDGDGLVCGWWRLWCDTTRGGQRGWGVRHGGLTESLACKRLRHRGDGQPPHDWQMGQRVHHRNQPCHRGLAHAHDGSDDACRDSRQASPQDGSLRERRQAGLHHRSYRVAHWPSPDHLHDGMGSPVRRDTGRPTGIDMGLTDHTDAGRRSPARSIVRARLTCSQQQPDRAEEPGAEHEPHEARSPACPCQWMSPNSPAQGSHVPNPSS